LLGLGKLGGLLCHPQRAKPTSELAMMKRQADGAFGNQYQLQDLMPTNNYNLMGERVKS
jgi:hypothetical protein